MAAASAAAMAIRVVLMQCSLNDAVLGYTPISLPALSRTGQRRRCYFSQKLDLVMPEKAGNAMLSPGEFVHHPGRPDWGLGKIHSMIGPRIQVNLENTGKVTIEGNVIELVPADPGAPDVPHS